MFPWECIEDRAGGLAFDGLHAQGSLWSAGRFIGVRFPHASPLDPTAMQTGPRAKARTKLSTLNPRHKRSIKVPSIGIWANFKKQNRRIGWGPVPIFYFPSKAPDRGAISGLYAKIATSFLEFAQIRTHGTPGSHLGQLKYLPQPPGRVGAKPGGANCHAHAFRMHHHAMEMI